MGSLIQQTLMFIVQFIFGLYSFMIVLRLWVRLSGVTERHPLLIGIGKTTSPLIRKLQALIPDLGRFESSSLLLLLVVTLLKLLLMSFLSGHMPHLPGLLAWILISAIEVGFDTIFYVMILMAILSWIPNAQPAMLSLLTQISVPLLAPIRKFIPLFGGMDLSPVVLLLIVQVMEIVFVHPVMRASLMATFY